jgi:3-oxoacyl-[acyl-carrier protein] reductase
MMKQKWDCNINFSGVDRFLGGSLTTGMAKLGIIGFTRAIAREFGEYDMTAHCIGPGSIDVERDAFQMRKGLKPQQPTRHLGKPREIVSVMAFLATEDAGYITGQACLANGGLYFH